MADVFIELLLTHMAANENLRLGTSPNYTMIFHVEDTYYLKIGISRNFPEFCRIDLSKKLARVSQTLLFLFYIIF